MRKIPHFWMADGTREVFHAYVRYTAQVRQEPALCGYAGFRQGRRTSDPLLQSGQCLCRECTGKLRGKWWQR